MASNRARAHESKDASLGPTGGQKFDEALQDAAVAANRDRRTQQGTSQTGSSAPPEVLPLVPLGSPDNQNLVKLRTGMWYI